MLNGLPQHGSTVMNRILMPTVLNQMLMPTVRRHFLTTRLLTAFGSFLVRILLLLLLFLLLIVPRRNPVVRRRPSWGHDILILTKRQSKEPPKTQA